MSKNKALIKCASCGCELAWDIGGGKSATSSSFLEEWHICKDCMIEHCVNANCLACNYGKYPDCRFLEMKIHYRDSTT